jgi:hypothetical protein
LSNTTVGREPIVLVQIDQDRCTRTFGVSPCNATGERCYNTRKTCSFVSAYNRGTLTLTFAQPTTALPKDQYRIPLVSSVSTAPTKLNPATGDLNNSALGERGVLTVTFNDAPHSDFLVDPYLSTRTFDPLERSTFWAKWLARNYYQNRLVRLYEGYVGQTLAQMSVRHYLIDSIVGPDSSQRVKLVAKDPLKLSEKERSQIPRASTGKLYRSIAANANSFLCYQAVAADYDQPGFVRINDEIVSYSTISTTGDVLTFNNVVRGLYGTVQQDHDENSSVQKVVIFADKVLWQGVKELLVNWAGISASYINDAEWQTEYNNYLAQYNFSSVLSEPESVFDVLNQLCQQLPFYLFWDDRNNKIQFKAVRYYSGTFPVLTETNIIENSFSVTTNPRDRISQVWVYHSPRDWTKTDRINYKRVEINANLELESRDFFDEKKIRIIESRFLSDAQAYNLTSRLIRANYDNPLYVKLRLDAKDR